MSQQAAFFERPIPIALVLGVFLFGVIPLALVQLVPNHLSVVPLLTLVCAVGLGTTHFFLTLAVYLSPSHLSYFASSTSRVLIYFVMPIAILALLAWIGSSGVRETHPAGVAYFFAFVRLLDFFHVGRQSFGILQLWKRPLQATVPAWTRSAENAFFVGAAAMQWQTFWLGGQFPAHRTEGVIPAAALGVLFVIIAGQYVRQLAAGGGRKAALPLAYFVIQAVCSAAAVYRTWLYLTVLAVHYLEYHVIMYPRCFGAAEKGGWLRRSPFLFYAVLLAVVLLFELRNTVQSDSRALLFLVHMFDGIFLTHYVLDAFLWRFGNPFYRETLGRLYLRPAAVEPVPEPAPPRPRRTRSWMLALAGAAAVVLLAWTQTGSPRVQSLGAALADPIHARNHLRWGIELAERGDYTEARRHLNAALERDPSSRDAQSALRWVEERAARSLTE